MAPTVPANRRSAERAAGDATQNADPTAPDGTGIETSEPDRLEKGNGDPVDREPSNHTSSEDQPAHPHIKNTRQNEVNEDSPQTEDDHLQTKNGGLKTEDQAQNERRQGEGDRARLRLEVHAENDQLQKEAVRPHTDMDRSRVEKHQPQDDEIRSQNQRNMSQAINDQIQAETNQTEAEEDLPRPEEKRADEETVLPLTGADHTKADSQQSQADDNQLQAKSLQPQSKENQLQAGKDLLQAGKDQLQAEKDQLQAEKDRLQAEMDWLQVEKSRLKADKDRLREEKDRLKAENDWLQAEKDRLRAGAYQPQVETDLPQSEKYQLQEEKNRPQAETCRSQTRDQPQTETDQPQTEENQPQEGIDQIDQDQPQTERYQPQTEEDRPQTKTDQPQAERDQLQTEKDQPQTGRDQPQTETDQPQTEKDQPQPGEDQPQTEGDQSQTEKDQLQAEADQPQTKTDQHQAERDQPQTEKDQPQTEGGQSQTEKDQLQAEAYQPQTKTGQPQAERDQLQMETDRPHTEKDQPQAEWDQPQEEKDQLQADKDQPRAEADQPQTETDQPEAETYQLEAEKDLPQGEGDQAKVENHQRERFVAEVSACGHCELCQSQCEQQSSTPSLLQKILLSQSASSSDNAMFCTPAVTYEIPQTSAQIPLKRSRNKRRRKKYPAPATPDHEPSNIDSPLERNGAKSDFKTLSLEEAQSKTKKKKRNKKAFETVEEREHPGREEISPIPAPALRALGVPIPVAKRSGRPREADPVAEEIRSWKPQPVPPEARREFFEALRESGAGPPSASDDLRVDNVLKKVIQRRHPAVSALRPYTLPPTSLYGVTSVQNFIANGERPVKVRTGFFLYPEAIGIKKAEQLIYNGQYYVGHMVGCFYAYIFQYEFCYFVEHLKEMTPHTERVKRVLKSVISRAEKLHLITNSATAFSAVPKVMYQIRSPLLFIARLFPMNEMWEANLLCEMANSVNFTDLGLTFFAARGHYFLKGKPSPRDHVSDFWKLHAPCKDDRVHETSEGYRISGNALNECLTAMENDFTSFCISTPRRYTPLGVVNFRFLVQYTLHHHILYHLQDDVYALGASTVDLFTNHPGVLLAEEVRAHVDVGFFFHVANYDEFTWRLVTTASEEFRRTLSIRGPRLSDDERHFVDYLLQYTVAASREDIRRDARQLARVGPFAFQLATEAIQELQRKHGKGTAARFTQQATRSMTQAMERVISEYMTGF